MDTHNSIVVLRIYTVCTTIKSKKEKKILHGSWESSIKNIYNIICIIIQYAIKSPTVEEKIIINNIMNYYYYYCIYILRVGIFSHIVFFFFQFIRCLFIHSRTCTSSVKVVWINQRRITINGVQILLLLPYWPN